MKKKIKKARKIKKPVIKRRVKMARRKEEPVEEKIVEKEEIKETDNVINKSGTPKITEG